MHSYVVLMIEKYVCIHTSCIWQVKLASILDREGKVQKRSQTPLLDYQS